MSSEMKKLIIIVPAYNEAKTIKEAISGLLEVRKRFIAQHIMLMIYVIDDGSTDGTQDLAIEAGADRVLRHQVNQGLGAAVRTGLVNAKHDKADIVVKIDADLQHDPQDIPTLVQPILNDNADVVYGNRLERIDYKMPLMRRIGNIVFTTLMRQLTQWPVRDSQPGIFAINKLCLDIVYLPTDYNYTQQILLDSYYKGMRFAHVPVAFRKRTTGISFVSLRYPLKVLPQIVILLTGIKPMRIFSTVGFFILSISGITFFVEIMLWFFGKTNKPAVHVYAILGTLFFGLQTLFFGILAELIVRFQRR